MLSSSRENAKLRFEKAKSLSDEMRTEEAEAILMDLLSFPDTGIELWRLYLELGDVTYYGDDLTTAHQWLLKAESAFNQTNKPLSWPDSYRLEYLLGAVENQLDRYRQAIVHLTKAKSIGQEIANETRPEWLPHLALNLARSHIVLSEFEEAIEVIEEGLAECTPAHNTCTPYLQCELVHSLTWLGRFEEAISVGNQIDRGLLKGTHPIDLDLSLMRCHIRIGNFTTARELETKMDRDTELNLVEKKELYYLAGLLCSRTGDENGAISAFHKAEQIAGEPTWVDVELRRIRGSK